MPIRKLIAEDHTSPEVAKIMLTAFDAVQAYATKNKLNGITSGVIARKVFTAVTDGERDAAIVAAAIIKELAARKAVPNA